MRNIFFPHYLSGEPKFLLPQKTCHTGHDCSETKKRQTSGNNDNKRKMPDKLSGILFYVGVDGFEPPTLCL